VLPPLCNCDSRTLSLSQHLVDLFGQFYKPMGPLLPRLLDLLRGFIARSHASLASVGVAAYTRMVASCGTKLDSDAWQQVGLHGFGCSSLGSWFLSVCANDWSGLIWHHVHWL
jgi:hypothetical protein